MRKLVPIAAHLFLAAVSAGAAPRRGAVDCPEISALEVRGAVSAAEDPRVVVAGAEPPILRVRGEPFRRRARKEPVVVLRGGGPDLVLRAEPGVDEAGLFLDVDLSPLLAARRAGLFTVSVRNGDGVTGDPFCGVYLARAGERIDVADEFLAPRAMDGFVRTGSHDLAMRRYAGALACSHAYEVGGRDPAGAPPMTRYCWEGCGAHWAGEVGVERPEAWIYQISEERRTEDAPACAGARHSRLFGQFRWLPREIAPSAPRVAFTNERSASFWTHGTGCEPAFVQHGGPAFRTDLAVRDFGGAAGCRLALLLVADHPRETYVYARGWGLVEWRHEPPNEPASVTRFAGRERCAAGECRKSGCWAETPGGEDAADGFPVVDLAQPYVWCKPSP